MSSPNAKQARWRAWIADQGCCVSDEDYRVQVHHMFGRETKVKGIGGIGHWAIICLAWRYHDVASDDPFNVTHHKNAFEDEFGKQVMHFEYSVNMAAFDPLFDNKNLPPEDVVSAIMGYRK